MFPHDEFLAITNISSYQVMKRFKSKKNEVYKIVCSSAGLHREKTLVVKKYAANLTGMAMECMMYEYLKGTSVNIPRLYFKGSDFIVMEYIEGVTLVEYIDSMETGINVTKKQHPRDEVLKYLVDWLIAYYIATRDIFGHIKILNDVNLRNFILTSTGILGIDLEECREGNVEQDIAKMCIYMLNYYPEHTNWKTEFVKDFIGMINDRYPINTALFEKEYDKEKEELIKRRGVAPFTF